MAPGFLAKQNSRTSLPCIAARPYLSAKETERTQSILLDLRPPAPIYTGRADACTHHVQAPRHKQRHARANPPAPSENQLASMALSAQRSMASALLLFNLIMYVVVAAIAGWAINYSIDESMNSRNDINLSSSSISTCL